MSEPRLEFQKREEHIYHIINADGFWIGNVERIRNGKFMHYNLVIPLDLMMGCVGDKQFLSFSPGCQDEVREFCKKLNGNKHRETAVQGGKE